MIDEQSSVTLHFSLALDDGSFVDSTFDKQPASFKMGDGSLMPGFEKKLLGLNPGDKQRFVLSASEAFGDVNEESIHELGQSQFKGMILEEGLIVSFDGAGKQAMPGIVRSVNNDIGKVTVDFNHPLAGRTIHFSVEIVSVHKNIEVKSL